MSDILDKLREWDSDEFPWLTASLIDDAAAAIMQLENDVASQGDSIADYQRRSVKTAKRIKALEAALAKANTELFSEGLGNIEADEPCERCGEMLQPSSLVDGGICDSCHSDLMTEGEQ